ncbi:MAG: amidohydrolase family protein [Polyangiaceae bacterium]
MKLVHADAIVLGDRATLRDGAVVLDENGTVCDVGPAVEVRARSTGAEVERVRGVVLPGLVNAHTHVELSALAGKVRAGGGFVRWADELIALRAELEEDEVAAAIGRAVTELDAGGTIAVGDVTNTLGAVAPLAAAGISGAIFHEVFGIVRASAMTRVEALRAEVGERLGAWPSRELSYAPSPHTLYTTHPDAVRALLGMSRERGVRASVHFLEHAAERRAIEHGDGDAPRWLASRVPGGADFVWPKRPTLEYARSLGVVGPDVLLVHLTEARVDELAELARAEAPVVVCPRSNWTIEARVPPVAEMLAAGLEPALGTDSLASSPSLDVLEEAAALVRLVPSVDADRALTMATWNGARALGRADLGRIAMGTRPSIFAIDAPLGDGDAAGAHVLANTSAPRRWIARRGLHVSGVV